MIRRFAAVLSLVLLATLVPAKPVAAYEAHVLRFSDTLDINTLNLWIATSGNIIPLSELTNAYFTRIDPKGNPIPELVTVIPSTANGGISKDGKTITWHLRRGVKWSDGVPFDSSDVTYTWRVAKDPTNNIAVRDIWTRLADITAPDAETVVFHLKTRYATFAADFFSTRSNASVLPKHILGPGTNFNEAPYNALPVGIGPFRYTAFHRGDDVEMEANPYYWHTPKLKRIIYKLIADDNTDMTQLTTGELDLWDTINGTLAPQAKALPGKAWSTRLSEFMTAIFLNTSLPALKDPAVRRALRLATNRPLIFDKVMLRNGVMTESVVPQMAHGYINLPVTKYDPAAAEKMLDAAGWKRAAPGGVRAKNGVPLAFDIAIPSGYAPSTTLAALLQSAYAAIGVTATIHAYASGTYFAPYSAGGILQTGKFGVSLHSESLGPVYGNINGALTCDSIPPNGFNETKYCNKSVDALNDVYQHSYDRAVQDKAAAAFQRAIDNDAPWIMIYERAYLAVYDKRLTGYHPDSFSYWGVPWDMDI
jgi:peptide/nickel transport system substrate-binding protein